MKEIIEARIEALNKDLKKVNKRIYAGAPDLVRHTVEAEKIKFAIAQLYTCMGQSV